MRLSILDNVQGRNNSICCSWLNILPGLQFLTYASGGDKLCVKAKHSGKALANIFLPHRNTEIK